MDKVARKPSSDPVQEKLRLNKAQWNKEVSTFINDLINFKKTMNGWPSKFHMERSSIKEPIPADPATIIGSLAGDFQELAQRGNDLISQQLEYSKARKKTQPKAPKAPGAPTPATPSAPAAPTAPDLSQQLSLPAVAEIDYNLVAEGSNPITRFISTLKGPWFGTGPESRSRKYRVAMLKASADLNRELNKFEAQIMGSSPESIFAAGKMLTKIENQLFYLKDSLSSQKTPIIDAPNKSKKPDGNIPSGKEVSTQTDESIPEKPIAVSPDDPTLAAIRAAVADFRKSKPNFTDLNPLLERTFASMMLKFYNAPTNEDKIRFAPPLLKAYQDLLADANMRHGTNAPTLAEVLMPKTASAQLEAVAQNFLTKWLGQVKHQLSPFDKTSALRLDLLKLSKESRKVLNQMMDALEKDIDPKLLEEYLEFIDKNLVAMRQAMKPLESTIRGNMFDKTFLNMLKNKKITEHNLGLDPKQQAQLERTIQQRQFRELSNLYRK